MDKTLKTRISLLYKTQVEWENIGSTFIPLKGEMCFCEIPGKASKFKVGNGKDTYNNLPWADLEGATRIFPVSQYGFDTNLRINQHVTGRVLIDEVIDTLENKGLVPVIKAGEYKFFVSEILNNSESGDDTVAFTCIGNTIDFNAPDFSDIKPISEKIIFITNNSQLRGDTYTFYGSDRDYASKADLETVVDALESIVDEVELLDKLADVEIKLGPGFVPGILTSFSQNDLRLYLPKNCFADVEHQEGIDNLYGQIRVFPLNLEAEDPIGVKLGTITRYKAGNYENYHDEFEVITSNTLIEEDDTARKYADFRILLATWDGEKWVEESVNTTDNYYPNYGMLIEWYSADERLLGSYSKRISISDFAHFYNNKDWYAVEYQKTQVDAKSITYNGQDELQLMHFNSARHGQLATKDDRYGLVWTDPLNQDALNEAVEKAANSASLAGNYLETAKTYAQDANRAAKEAEEILDTAFWKGTQEEYNALTSINPDTIYLVLL